MNRCKDCRLWRQTYADEEWGDCAGFGEDGPTYIRTNGDESATLVTRSDFGCVMWEPKP